MRITRTIWPVGLSIVLAALGVTGLVAVSPDALSAGQAEAQTAGNCGLAQPAFCETFDAPSAAGAGTRSGNLNGVLWGVSRATSNDNPSQNMLERWAAGTRSTCGANQTVSAQNDVAICNGQFVETVNDDDSVTVLAAYPRQPFDIAGRTGVVTFDVSNDTQGPHAAWPAFVYTDQPVPAPYGESPGVIDTPRNSFGFSIADPNCPLTGDGSQTSVDTMWVTSNYQFASQSFRNVGCITKANGTGQLNHFEVRLSQSHVEVWGTDPGGTTLKQLAVGDFTVPLTRGLIWMEDVHYNANKFNSQGNHTFVWDNVGFDGPVLPRDLGFDVMDATTNFSSTGNLGYLVPTGGRLTLQIPNVSGLQNASAALLEFTFVPHGQDSFTYAFNGHAAHTQAWPFGANGPTYASQTIAMPVPLSDLQAGTNTLVLTSTDNQLGGATVANIDLILVGAGGIVPPGGGAGGPPPPPITSSTIRVNAGGPAYSGGDGRDWQADNGFNGGTMFSTGAAISGTADGALYQTERYGNVTYTLSVPNGTYNVVLKFAEIFWSSPGQRVFNVSINGQQVLTNFDILANVPKNTALDNSFLTSVTNGTVTITLSSVQDYAKISAIEITPNAASATGVRVNSGGAAYIGADGRKWQTDVGFNGGATFSTTAPIAATADGKLYQTERYGNVTYTLPVPNGTYNVVLKFAEIFWSSPGQRVFNVSINSRQVLTNFDILANVPRNTALDKAFSTTVSNGAVKVTLSSIRDYAKISAIEIVSRP